jgi:uncharacterized protein YkwD
VTQHFARAVDTAGMNEHRARAALRTLAWLASLAQAARDHRARDYLDALELEVVRPLSSELRPSA